MLFPVKARNMLRATRRVLRAVRATDHVTLQRKPINDDNGLLHAAYLKNGYKSCVWASADVVRNCRLAKGGAQPVAVPITAGVIGMYNLDQLITFARTATGKWFPANFHRELAQRQYVNGVFRYKSNVWFSDTQVAAGQLEPLQRENTVTVEHNVLFNAAQLKSTAGGHTFHNGAVMRISDDQLVLQYVAAKEGFASKKWVATTMVGPLDGVTPLAHVWSTRHGTVPMYNLDQLEWPIPVPAEPHSWATTGSAMLPHQQLFLEKVMQRRGFASRQWYSAPQQIGLDNVMPGALPVVLQTPTDSVELLNRNQLLASPRSQ
jgi:hypothetical protein